MFKGEALGAIGDIQVIPILEEYSKDSVKEVAETCQLALELIKWLEQSKNSPEKLPENPYASVDPAPPIDIKKVSVLKEILLDEDATLFDRYRAMFALRNLKTEESILALAAGLNFSWFSRIFSFTLLIAKKNTKEILNSLKKKSWKFPANL